ncbi:hypothetical protein K469DRAFT_465963, partial [Zopfia rhizophila CBS 207.26]
IPSEHELVSNARAGIKKFRLRSPINFALHIAVEDRDADADEQTGPDFTADCRRIVVFSTYDKDFRRACRPFVSRGRVTHKVQVHDKGKWLSLDKWLMLRFPPHETALCNEDTMREFWDENGKFFSWALLPDELKENILKFCLFQPHENEYTHQLRRRQRRPQVYEIVDQLGRWQSLLRASKKIRGIILHLILKEDEAFSAGLTIHASSSNQFRKDLIRLSNAPQLIDDDSLPRTAREQYLARKYLNHPKLYPELDRFATMMHGIRRLSLDFNFLSYLHFFKFSLGGFDHFRPRHFVTCDVLDRLLHLNGILIRLPHQPWRDYPRHSVQLWDELDPCPRTLHRWIYERAADALVGVKHVIVTGFMDEVEEDNFYELHRAAKLLASMSEEDMRSLYGGTDGGIELEDNSKDVVERSEMDPNVFPPVCRCEVECKKL